MRTDNLNLYGGEDGAGREDGGGESRGIAEMPAKRVWKKLSNVMVV